MQKLVNDYLELWNETDADRRAERISGVFTEDAMYLDPLMRGQGHGEIDALIGGVHAQFPGFVFAPNGEPQEVGDHVRFSWTLGPAGGAPLAAGTDFARVIENRFADVVGFLDPVG